MIRKICKKFSLVKTITVNIQSETCNKVNKGLTHNRQSQSR